MPPYQRQAAPSKGNFLSWDAGESKDLVILSKRGTESYTHWVDGESRDCIGEGCSLCAEGLKRTVRWAVLTKCEDEEILWVMSNTCFFGVEDVAEMVGELKDLRLRVTRHGSGLKTRYSILPITGEAKAPEEHPGTPKYAAEIKRLCALANLDPKQELGLFLAEAKPEAASYPPLEQMQAFYVYIVDKTVEFQPIDEPAPEEEQDIGRYF